MCYSLIMSESSNGEVIGRYSPLHDRTIRTAQEKYPDPGVFGKKIITDIDSATPRFTDYDTLSDEIKALIPSWILNPSEVQNWIPDRQRLADLAPSLFGQAHMLSFLNGVPFEVALPNVIGKNTLPFSIEDIGNFAKLPDSLLESLTRTHQEKFSEQNSVFQEKLPQLLSDFTSRVGAWISSGAIPLTPEELEKRLSTAQYSLVDPLSHPPSDAFGTYNMEQDKVEIASPFVDDQTLLELATTHELFHVISGRTWTKKGGNRQTVSGLPALPQRVGLQLNRDKKSDSGSTYATRFLWLNEGVTQILTESLLNKSAPLIYPDEKVIVEGLLKPGSSTIPFSTLLHPYFEDYDPDNTSGDNLQGWHYMSKIFDAAYGSNGSLTSLDRFIATKTVKSAADNFRAQK